MNASQTSSQDLSQKSGKGRFKEKFAGKFNTRTQKLIELSKSNSCSALPAPVSKRESENSSAVTYDGLSQSSGSGVTNREKQRLKRMKEREKAKPVELDVKEQIGLPAAAQLLYGELLGKNSPISAFDVLLATLRANLHGFWVAESEDVGESFLRKLIRENLLLSTEQLADKYLLRSGDTPVDQKLNEYKLQTLLTLFATLPEKENDGDSMGDFVFEEIKLGEVVQLLRMLSASADTSAMQAFLNNEVLETFLHRIPRHLTRIYEELYQRVPPDLSSYACHDSEEGECDSGFFLSPKVKSIGAADDSLSQNPRRPLVRRASFLNPVHQQKLLAVSSNGAKELKVRAEKKDKSGSKREKGRAVRRSLTFDSQPKHQTPMKDRVGTAIIKPSSRTPKRKRPHSALVEETPIHKQQPLSEYRRERYQRISSGSVRQIITETPQKELPSFTGTRKSPRNHPSSRPSYAASPTALYHLDEENMESSSAAIPSTSSFSASSNQSSSPAKVGVTRRQRLLQEFLTGHKSPRKRFGKTVRALMSPCSKPVLKQDTNNAGKRVDFSLL